MFMSPQLEQDFRTPRGEAEDVLVCPLRAHAVTCREGSCRFGDSCAKMGNCLAVFPDPVRIELSVR